MSKNHYWFFNKIKIKNKIYFKRHSEMILILVTFISSSLSKNDHFLAPKPTPPNGECLDTLEYCKLSYPWLQRSTQLKPIYWSVLEMCGSLPKDLPFCNPDSPDYEGHDCMTCIVECYGETVGQGKKSISTLRRRGPTVSFHDYSIWAMGLWSRGYLTSSKVFECGIDQGWVPPSDLSCLNHFAEGKMSRANNHYDS